MENIRNFSVIAHIDHGKSTLSDRLIEFCGGLSSREMEDQILDSMDIERERGITIKAQAVSLKYKLNNKEYLLNFIDTPGHVDFSYEVSRSLSACEGALLVVDGSQGVEAQTLANCYTAVEEGLEVLPVINKIDLPQAEPDRVKNEIEEMVGINASKSPLVSAKTGEGIEEIFDAIINKIPPPDDRSDKPLRAMIFDSVHDNYKGAIPYIRVFDGAIKAGEKAKFFAHDHDYDITEVGHFILKQMPSDELRAGDVGYFLGSIRDVSPVSYTHLTLPTKRIV